VRILLVDDSAAVRTRLIARLHEAGLEVAGVAGTANQAIALSTSLMLDAIVLDLNLPDKNGLDILPELKMRAPDAAIAILTNSTGPEYRRLCLADGADWFFDKSTELEDLVVALMSLDKRRH
jgi:DNA-binding NarL/FixJ family response regulator